MKFLQKHTPGSRVPSRFPRSGVDADAVMLDGKLNHYFGREVECIADGAIAKGDLVYPSGFDATKQKLKMKVADADAAAPAKVAWFVAPAAIANNAEGVVATTFLLDGQNTNAAAAVGAPVYLSTTAGKWTLTAPTGGGHAVQQVGVVTVKNATTGAVLLLPGWSKAVTVNTT